MAENTPKLRKKDTGEQGNGGQFGISGRDEAEVSVTYDPFDDSLEWDHEDAGISWEFPASAAESTVYENGMVADRVLLDGTVEHHDPDGTLTHVTVDDGSTILIDGDMDHPYVTHRKLAEFAFETHELSSTQVEARFVEMSPALSAHDPHNASNIGHAIADRMADDDLYETEELCEGAAQQHALTVWMRNHPAPPTPRIDGAVPPQNLDEAREMRDRLLATFPDRCQDEELPTGPAYTPIIMIDHGKTSVGVEVRNVPDSTMRNRYDGNETTSPVGEELRDRVGAVCRRAGVEVDEVTLESDMQRGMRRLRTYQETLRREAEAA